MGISPPNMKAVCSFVVVIVLIFQIEARSRVKRDSWRRWHGLQANCDASPRGNPCITCTCQELTRYQYDGQTYIFNSCEEITKLCYTNVACADSIVKSGECCPSCPNGPNCKIYGKIMTPSQQKIFKPGSNSEYSLCGVRGEVTVCHITTINHGYATSTRTMCRYSVLPRPLRSRTHQQRP